MAKSYKNLCWHSTATSGSGTITIGAVITGFASILTDSGLDGATLNYVIRDGNDWEIGTGVFDHTAGTLTRVLVESSTGSLLSLSGSGVTVAIGDVAKEDLDALAAKASAGFGGLVSRPTTTTLSVSAGKWAANDGSTVTWGTAITLDIAVAGTFVNSSSRATNTWYHVLVGRETSSGNVVGGLSTTLAKPSGWDNWQMLGACRTNATGSGDLINVANHASNPGLFYRPDLNVNTDADYTITSTTTTSQTIRAFCPPMSCRVLLFGRWLDPSLTIYLSIEFTSISGASKYQFNAYPSNGVQGNYFGTAQTDSSGQYFIRSTGTITYTQLLGFTQGFFYPRGQAGYV